MTDNVTPTQADRDAASDIIMIREPDGVLADMVRKGKADHARTVQLLARHRIDAIATQAAEIARLEEELSDEASRSRMARNNVLNGTPVMVLRSYEGGGYGAGFYTPLCPANPDNLRAEIARLRELVVNAKATVDDAAKLYGDDDLQNCADNILDAALSAQPDDQEEDDLPEEIGKCETCRAIIRDGDVFVMDDYCVCLCRKCMADDQGAGNDAAT